MELIGGDGMHGCAIGTHDTDGVMFNVFLLASMWEKMTSGCCVWVGIDVGLWYFFGFDFVGVEEVDVLSLTSAQLGWYSIFGTRTSKKRNCSYILIF